MAGARQGNPWRVNPLHRGTTTPLRMWSNLLTRRTKRAVKDNGAFGSEAGSCLMSSNSSSGVVAKVVSTGTEVVCGLGPSGNTRPSDRTAALGCQTSEIFRALRTLLMSFLSVAESAVQNNE